jgi:two-component system, NarL family, response regulator LiaR
MIKRPSVLLADDDPGITQILRDILAEEFEVVGTAPNGLVLLDAAAELDPDVIVADIFMPLLDGLGALTRLKQMNPRVKVVLITMYNEPALAIEALDDGACGFVLKSFAPEELIAAVWAALDGKTYISPVLAAKMTR